MRILVCGGRDYTDRDTIYKTLYDFCDEKGLWTEPDAYGNKLPVCHIISGEARGADQIATDWAVINWVGYSGFPADWDKYGRKAGPIRNQQMLDEGKPDIVFAFPGPQSRGTYDMIKRAEKAKVEVRVIE